MIVVSDTSVLINLARLDKLFLLHKLYGNLLIPLAVWREVVERGAGKPGADEVKAADWIQVREVANTALVRALRQDLDAGEAEAIALAVEVNADLLLMDERLGRATAQHFGLRYIGLIGVLLMARQRKLITEIKPDLDRLRQVAGFYISESLYKRVLKDAAET
jgi:predicted nucleic acid-binding protein